MAMETKPLTSEDVARIVEQALEKRDTVAKQKRREGLEVDGDDIAKLELQADMIGEAVEAALERHAEKQAAAAAKAKAEAEEKAKAERERTQRRSRFPF